MNKTIYTLIAVSILMISANVFAQQQIVPERETYPTLQNEGSEIKLAKECLENLVNEYQNEKEELFFNYVSERYLQQYLDFKTRVNSDFRTFSSIRIQYYVDDEEKEADRVSLTVRWNRSWQTLTAAAPTLTQGNAKLLFEIKDGKAYLIDQQGDPLFGVTNMN